MRRYAKNIIEIVNKYKNERPEAKLGQHLYAIPKKANDMIKEQTFYYDTSTRKRTAVDFTKEACYELDYILFSRLNAHGYYLIQDSIYPTEELIERGLIHPFMLFINGRFIKWENITLVSVTEKHYFLIKDLDQQFFDDCVFGISNAELVLLPQDIVYKVGGFELTDRTMFAFDENGLLVKEGEAEVVIDSDDEKLYIASGDLIDPYFVIRDDTKHSYFGENVIVFKDNKYWTTDVTVLGPVAYINSGFVSFEDNVSVRAFYNDRATPTYNNLFNADFNQVFPDIIATLAGWDIPYMQALQEPFDITFDRNKSYEENREYGLDTIAHYDHRLFNEYYKYERNFESITVDYSWVMGHLNEDGYMQLPRRFDLNTNFYLVVFNNGKLYEYYHNSYYRYGNYYCPVDGFKEGDKIEIWYFKGSKNHAYDMNISKNEPYLPLDTDYYYVIGETRIFCPYFSEKKIYDFTDGRKDLQHFPVDFSFEYDEDVKRFRVRFESDFYYDKDLILANGNRFVYHSFPVIINEEGREYADFYKIDMGDKFMYCNEYDKYMIFYNGCRIDSDHYRLVIPCREETPFTRFQLYICKPMKDGDRIDVFYLPNHFTDVFFTTQQLNNTGEIRIDKSFIWMALDNELFTYWVNGKKIHKDAIEPLSSTTVQIMEDQHSIEDLRVTCMLGRLDKYEELIRRFKDINSLWDQACDYGDPLKIKGLYYRLPFYFSNDEPFFFTDAIESKYIVKELIRDWYWGNPLVDITKPFVFGYEDVDNGTIFSDEIDSAGNHILDVAESERFDNLDVMRPIDSENAHYVEPSEELDPGEEEENNDPPPVEIGEGEDEI